MSSRKFLALFLLCALVPLAGLQAPAVDPSNPNAQKVTDLMTKAGLL